MTLYDELCLCDEVIDVFNEVRKRKTGEYHEKYLEIAPNILNCDKDVCLKSLDTAKQHKKTSEVMNSNGLVSYRILSKPKGSVVLISEVQITEKTETSFERFIDKTYDTTILPNNQIITPNNSLAKICHCEHVNDRLIIDTLQDKVKYLKKQLNEKQKTITDLTTFLKDVSHIFSERQNHSKTTTKKKKIRKKNELKLLLQNKIILKIKF